MPASESTESIFHGQPKIMSAWLFGSQITGQARSDSDFDIGILVSEPLTLDELLQLQMALGDIYKSDDIDLSILNKSSAALRFEALSGVNLFCRDENLQAAFHSRTARDYEESMVMWAKGLRYRKQALEQAN